jgi:hypothetical protein
VVSWASRIEIIRLFLASWMTFWTSAVSFLVQRSPVDSTVRTPLAPSAATSAYEDVRLVYQVCAWFTPRKMNGVPFFSTSFPLAM